VEERIYLLKSLREDVFNDTVIARINNPAKFQISSFASIQIFKGTGLSFFSADDYNIVNCFIKEQSIYEAFCDFFKYLPDSDLLYSKEETLQVLDDFILQL
jgi:hypothetical protein